MSGTLVVTNLFEGIAVRDTKDREGGTLVFPRAKWTAFIEAATSGEFDSWRR